MYSELRPCMSQRRKILVTSALPYANGDLHLGHIMEQIQTDIWVGFQKLRGHHCLYVCAADALGTDITLKAEELGISPVEHIEYLIATRQESSTGYHVHYTA